MPQPHLVANAASTALDGNLDHEAIFLRDVLQRWNGRSQHDTEELLHQRAPELGILDLTTHARSTVPQPPPPILSRFSLDSMASRESRSTGFTSVFSDVSRDAQHPSGPSIRDYKGFLARGVPSKRRQSISTSPPTTPATSVLSLRLHSPLGSSRRHFRRLRGLAKLRLNRSVSSSTLSRTDRCPHCSPGLRNHRRAVHHLPCGHKFCTQGLRSIIKAAACDDAAGTVPSCCGVPVPGRLVEHVMSQTEQQILLGRLEQWNEATSMAPCCPSPRDSVISRAPPRDTAASRTTSSDPDGFETSITPQKPNCPATLAALRELRREQDAERDRLQVWAQRHQSQLETHHQELRRLLQSSHQAANQDLEKRQQAAMSDAEDKQVQAEADLRDFLDQERRDDATALRHMEAYCAGTYSTGAPHFRIVTDQDLAELEKTRRTRDQMNARHESQINVLRGEQSRRMRKREQRQESELRCSMQQLAAEAIEFEQACAAEMQAFDRDVEQKQRQTAGRWRLQTTRLVKEQELAAGTNPGPVEDDEEDDETDDGLDPTAIALANFGLTTPFTMREAA